MYSQLNGMVRYGNLNSIHSKLQLVFLLGPLLQVRWYFQQSLETGKFERSFLVSLGFKFLHVFDRKNIRTWIWHFSTVGSLGNITFIYDELAYFVSVVTNQDILLSEAIMVHPGFCGAIDLMGHNAYQCIFWLEEMKYILRNHIYNIFVGPFFKAQLTCSLTLTLNVRFVRRNMLITRR